MKKLAIELKKSDTIKSGNVWGVIIEKRTTYENGKDINDDWREVLFDVEIIPSVINRRSKTPILKKQTSVEKQISVFYFRKTTMVECK